MQGEAPEPDTIGIAAPAVLAGFLGGGVAGGIGYAFVSLFAKWLEKSPVVQVVVIGGLLAGTVSVGMIVYQLTAQRLRVRRARKQGRA